MKLHPVCELFPRMNAEEFDSLKADIKNNGVREPITVLNDGKQGWLIDGKNRLKACESLGIECPQQEWKGSGSVVAWAVSKNLRRRHLSASERAVIAQDMLPLIRKETEAREKRGKGNDGSGGRGKKTLAHSCARVSDGKAASVAAKSTGVSSRSVEKAQTVAKADPAKLDEIRKGTKTVSAAYREVQAAKPKPAPTDGEGRAVDDEKLWPIFQSVELNEVMRMIQATRAKLKELGDSPIGTFLPLTDIDTHLDAARNGVKFAKPYAPCPACKHGCKACKGKRWVPKLVFESFPEELRK